MLSVYPGGVPPACTVPQAQVGMRTVPALRRERLASLPCSPGDCPPGLLGGSVQSVSRGKRHNGTTIAGLTPSGLWP